MFKKIMMAGLAVSALAINAPAASANHLQVNCRFNAVTQATATGQDTWEGAAEGYIVGDAGESVAVRCIVRVNGAIRAQTDWGTGSTFATTAGRVTYTRTLTEVTQLCAQYTSSHGGTQTAPHEVCFGTTTTQIPPQEVYDLVIDPLFDILIGIEEEINNITQPYEEEIDRQFCDELAALNDVVNGPVVDVRPGTADANGNRGGDVYINNILFWDCPGYEPPPAL